MGQEIINELTFQNQLDLVLTRNDFFDAFSDLEASVSKVLLSIGVGPSKEPFANRVKLFREAEKTPKIAKSNFPLRDKIADSIAELLPVRADIVHSHMKFCLVGRDHVAVFVNSQEACGQWPSGRKISLSQFKKLVRTLKSLHAQIEQLGRVVNPASSPQPPLPPAEVGP